MVYVFNREGLYYKIFLSLTKVLAYFYEGDVRAYHIEFDNEEKLDNFLLNIDLSTINT